MKKMLIELLIGLPIVIAVYILLDFIFCSWITHTDFVINAKSFVMPITTWVVLELVIFFSRRKKK